MRHSRRATTKEIDEALAFLKTRLANEEPHDSEKLISIARRRGISREAVWEASRQLGVMRQKDDDTGVWLWSWIDMSGIEFDL